MTSQIKKQKKGVSLSPVEGLSRITMNSIEFRKSQAFNAEQSNLSLAASSN